MSTHFAYSGFPVPSKIPGISLNCRRTSLTISPAALPTAKIVNAQNTKHCCAPINNPIKNFGLIMVTLKISTSLIIVKSNLR